MTKDNDELSECR